MSRHLQNDLNHLKREILDIGSMVEEATNKATIALTDRRLDLAGEVLHSDDWIDAKEVAIDEECLKILALHQPVATDLRFVITALKVNNDLERMGDLAVNIAERATYLGAHDPLPVNLDFSKMAESVRTMVRGSLDALVNQDSHLALKIWKMDDEVDAANRYMFDQMKEMIHTAPETINRALHGISASRHLERIADLATNIAEDIIFMVDGRVVRHRVEDYLKSQTEAEILALSHK